MTPDHHVPLLRPLKILPLNKLNLSSSLIPKETPIRLDKLRNVDDIYTPISTFIVIPTCGQHWNYEKTPRSKETR